MKHIAVVSHDAGGSEILVAYVREHLHAAHWTLCAQEGSSFAAIAAREGLKTQSIVNLAEHDALFFGTGWKHHPERPYVQEAKTLGIPSFAFLDHWSAYRERFDYPNDNWRQNLPDFIVVSDDKAQKIAQEQNLGEILTVPNLYLHNQLKNFEELEITPTQNLLFLSEPTLEVALASHRDANYWGFTQYTALEEILKHFEAFQCQGLHIRLHPSESNHRYHKVLKRFAHIKTQVYPASFYPLEKDILRSKMIIGFDTMALYTAALMGKALVSFLPSKNREFFLPLPSSHQLRSLDRLSARHQQGLCLKLPEDGIQFAGLEQKIQEYKAC